MLQTTNHSNCDFAKWRQKRLILTKHFVSSLSRSFTQTIKSARIEWPTSARDSLREAGAKVEFVEYNGGHGWHGDVFGNLRKGIEWLESQAAEQPKAET